VQQRICPIVGGVDTHLMIEIGNRNYTVHTAPVKVMKTYKAVFQTGDRIEIIGVHTTFQLMDTILAREIKDGSHDFVLRDEKGKPIW
jgi:hypothetical protein